MQQIPKIDYQYWAKISPFFGDSPLVPSIRVGLQHAQKGGLIDDVVTAIDTLSNQRLVEIIQEEILKVRLPVTSPGEEMLRIFDLIQGWGGKMCRGIYTKPKANPARISEKSKIQEQYGIAINHLSKKEVDLCLSALNKIPFLADAFSTKHIHFWSRYGNLGTNCSIYDSRIKALLYFSITKTPPYHEYLALMESVANDQSLNYHDVEAALFAFSSNWFGNGNLKLNSRVTDKTDQDEALRLNEIWESSRQNS